MSDVNNQNGTKHQKARETSSTLQAARSCVTEAVLQATSFAMQKVGVLE